MSIGTTKKLAQYVSTVQYEDFPDAVKDGAMRAVIDCVGNLIGGSIIDHREPLMKMARLTGGGVREATLVRHQEKVSMTAAAFGNGALSTMIDFCDGASSPYGHNSIWPGAITVPAALAAVEVSGADGRTFLASVVAGYECATRITQSMDIDTPLQGDVNSRGTTVLGAAAAAGRALGLKPDQMTSALGMAGIYCPVPAGYRFYADEGLTPRADITHGWAWMSMTGVFAAQSAAEGLTMLQEQNILDGDRGLWRMVGMNTFNPEIITGELGTKFYIPNFSTKK
ncbi:MmgE/PrpD family protein, partial [Chroococcidiopsidales cyanobacterium LEGE 13417]|nr:MmgE/PrpD family protein [Chroococcidiopsidales cyanobacterium LEGE 13417]